MVIRERTRGVLRGAGGGKGAGSSSGPKEAPNTLQAKSIARVVDILGEGPIQGLVNGHKSVFYDKTPLQAASGEYNFSGAVLNTRLGTPDQTIVDGFDAAVSTMSVNSEFKHMGDPYANALVRRVTDLSADAVRLVFTLNALTQQDTKTGDLNGFSVQYAIDVKSDADNPASTYVQRVVDRPSGKTTSVWPVSYRVGLDGVGPWDIRVRRISPDETETTKQNKTTWATMGVIRDHKLSYPHTAYVAQQIDSALFGNSIPTRGFEVDGLIIQVPTNYDPETRTYTGVWNGLFKTAYNNNPAWVLYDIVTNKRYGLGDVFRASRIDKWDLYAIAQYCDQLVPDGKGGQEPRFTFNGVINTKERAYAALSAISGMFRASLLWSGGKLRFFQDRPTTAAKIFGPANVVDGAFNYTGTALRARHTVCHVTWVNPAMGYEADIAIVEDPEAIDRYGYNVLAITAYGCTSQAQAMRHGRYALATERLETDTVQFRIGSGEENLLPGEVVKILDPTMTEAEWAGRLAAHTLTTVTFDRPIPFNPARTYTLTVVLADGTLATKAFTNPGASADSVTLTTPFASGNRPVANAMWAIESDVLTARTFRVMTMAEDGPDMHKVFAIQYAPEKYAEADNDIRLPGPGFSDLPDPTTVEQPANLTLEYITTRTTVASRGVINVNWDPSPDRYLRGYVVKYQYGDDSWIVAEEQKNSELQLIDPKFAVVRVLVYAVNQSGRMSAPISADLDLTTGTANGKNLISNLQCLGGGTEWTGQDLHVKWDAKSIYGSGDLQTDGSDPYFKQFRIRVFSQGGSLLKEYTTKTTEFVLPYDEMVAIGLARNYSLRVSLQDVIDAYSNEQVVAFSNPPPAIAIPVVETSPFDLKLNFPYIPDPDYEGVIVWMSGTDGFTPGPTNRVWKAPGNPVLAVPAGATMYYRYALYDAFGETGITVSPQYSEDIPLVPGGSIDTTPPAVPTGLSLSSAVRTDPTTGDVTTVLTATWTANGETDLYGYEVELTPSGGFPVTQGVINARAEWAVSSNTAYTVRVCAVDRSGNRSAYTSLSAHTTARDTTPPSAPTVPTATGLFASVGLSGTAPSAIDMASIQVFVNTTNNSGTATKVGDVAVKASGIWTFVHNVGVNLTRYYWVKAVDTSGNVSGFSPVASATTSGINESDLSNGLSPPLRGDYGAPSPLSANAPSLPSTGNYVGRVAINTNAAESGKLYRYTASGWSKAQDGADIQVGTLYGDRVVTGSLTTNLFAANSITVDKLAVVSTDNLIPNGNFESEAAGAQPLAWSRFTNTTGSDISVQASTTWPSYKALRLRRTTSTAGEVSAVADRLHFGEGNPAYNAAGFMMKPGDEVYVEGWVHQDVAGAAVIDIVGLNADGTLNSPIRCWSLNAQTSGNGTSNAAGIGGTINTWVKAQFYAQHTGSSSANVKAFLRFLASGNTPMNVYVGGLMVRRRNAGVMQVDGSIIARHVQAGSLTGDRFQANTIDTLQLKAGAVTASILNVGDTSNIYPDPDMRDAALWSSPDGASFSLLPTAGNYGSSSLLRINANADGKTVYGPVFTVEPGKPYHLSVRAYYLSAQTDSTAHVGIAWYSMDAAGVMTTISGDYVYSPTTGGTTAPQVQILPAPINARRARFYYVRGGGGSVAAQFAEPIARRANNGQMTVDGTLTAQHIQVASLTGDRFQANTIQGIHIASNTIGTNSLLVGATAENLVINGSGKEGNSGWNLHEGAGAGVTLTGQAGFFDSGRYGFWLGKPTTSTQTAWSARAFPVIPGRKYSVKFGVGGSSATANGLYVRITTAANRPANDQMTSANRNNYAPIIENGPVTGGALTNYEYVFTAAAGIYWAAFTIYNWVNGPLQLYFTDVEVKEQTTGVSIADGVITAVHVQAASLTGDRFAANTITANKLLVTNLSSISADLGSITAGSLNINNRFIVNSNGTCIIRSGTTGQRTEIDQNGGRVYDSAGTLRVRWGIW